MFNQFVKSIKSLFGGERIYIGHTVVLTPQRYGEYEWESVANMLPQSRDRYLLPEYSSEPPNIFTFARLNGYKIYTAKKWEVDFWVQMLQRGPVVIGSTEVGASFVVVGSIQTKGKPENTFFDIYDPKPIGRGTYLPNVSLIQLSRQYSSYTTCFFQK